MAIVQKTLNLNLNLPLPPCFVATYCSLFSYVAFPMPLKKRRGGSLGNIRPKKACATLKKVTVTSPEAACAHISSNAGTSHLLNDEEEVEWIDGPVSGPWQDISAAIDEATTMPSFYWKIRARGLGLRSYSSKCLVGRQTKRSGLGKVVLYRSFAKCCLSQKGMLEASS